jgi:hypothetical protein
MDKLTLHSALLQLQALNVAIRLTLRSVAIRAPNTRVPCLVRRAVISAQILGVISLAYVFPE